jgi:hypothetical protein
MKAITRFFVAATLAFMLTVSGTASADHGSSSSFGSPIRRPRAICGAWGCYVFPKRGKWARRGFRNFSLNLAFGGFSLSVNSYSPYYGGYGGYSPYYGYGSGYGYGAYGPYPPGDYRNAYAGLFGRYQFPAAWY